MAQAGLAQEPPLRSAAVVGLGLIGGSLALALRARGVAVCGYDLPHAAARARALGVLEEIHPSLEEAVVGREAVFLATPLDVLRELAQRALAAMDEGSLLTDVGSVKGPLVDAIADPRYIGGHPLAGGEQAGVEGARADLFEGAVWYLTPSQSSTGVLFERLHRLLRTLGARPLALPAALHDRLMAATSHLPHLLANLLVEQAAALYDADPASRPLLPSAAGPSFRDATRVAGSNPGIWAEIFHANRLEVLRQLDRFEQALRHARALLEEGEAENLAAWQERVATLRATLRASGPPEQGLVELSLRIPNRPGVVAALALRLGAAGINIHDLVLQPDPDRANGWLSLWVEEPLAQHARKLLDEVGV